MTILPFSGVDTTVPLATVVEECLDFFTVELIGVFDDNFD